LKELKTIPKEQNRFRGAEDHFIKFRTISKLLRTILKEIRTIFKEFTTIFKELTTTHKASKSFLSLMQSFSKMLQPTSRIQRPFQAAQGQLVATIFECLWTGTQKCGIVEICKCGVECLCKFVHLLPGANRPPQVQSCSHSSHNFLHVNCVSVIIIN
jgi:hypothetical protein